jgi:hypothetical protein
MSATSANAPAGATAGSAGETSTTTTSAIDVATDEYRNSANGLRATARSIASAFAAIPALAIVAALIKGPGSAGWQPGLLIPGIILAAAGATLGIYKLADVQRPGELTDATVTNEEMQRLPEAHGFVSFSELRAALENARASAARARMNAVDAQGYADADAAQVKAAQDTLTALVASAQTATSDERLNRAVADARQQVISTETAAAGSAAEAALAQRAAESARIPFAGFEALRRAAYGLALSDIIKQRFNQALWFVAIAVVLVAAGVTLVALAPKEKKSQTKIVPPTLWTLTLNSVGIKKLACRTSGTRHAPIVVSALKVGGSATRPHVITLPSRQCPRATELDFVSGPALGTAAPAKKAP